MNHLNNFDIQNSREKKMTQIQFNLTNIRENDSFPQKKKPKSITAESAQRLLKFNYHKFAIVYIH